MTTPPPYTDDGETLTDLRIAIVSEQLLADGWEPSDAGNPDGSLEAIAVKLLSALDACAIAKPPTVVSEPDIIRSLRLTMGDRKVRQYPLQITFTLETKLQEELLAWLDAKAEPSEAWRSIPPHDMVLRCPKCGKQHLDIGEFATRVHRKHLCENTPEGEKTGCGHLWVPLDYATRGVLTVAAGQSERERELKARATLAEQREKEARQTAEDWRQESCDWSDSSERNRQARNELRRANEKLLAELVEANKRANTLDAKLEGMRRSHDLVHAGLLEWERWAEKLSMSIVYKPLGALGLRDRLAWQVGCLIDNLERETKEHDRHHAAEEAERAKPTPDVGKAAELLNELREGLASERMSGLLDLAHRVAEALGPAPPTPTASPVSKESGGPEVPEESLLKLASRELSSRGAFRYDEVLSLLITWAENEERRRERA